MIHMIHDLFEKLNRPFMVMMSVTTIVLKLLIFTFSCQLIVFYYPKYAWLSSCSDTLDGRKEPCSSGI